MSKSQSLRDLVSERLTAAAEDIFALVERTIAEYEEELCRCKEENQRKQEILEELQKTHGGAGTGDKSEEEGPSLKQEAQWKQRHFQNVPPDLDFPKAEPGPGNNFESQQYSQHGESESGSSDVDNTDEEPQNDEANPDLDFYEQNEMESSENVGKTFSSRSSNQTRKFTRPPKQCAVCGKVFGDLKRHMTVHTGEKPYSCSVCEKRFTRKGSLQSHMAVHRGDTPFICQVCGKMFSQRGHLQTHALMHSGEKPFSCSVCNVKFSSKALLIRHRRVHTGVRPFSCPFCERGFTRNEHLRRHVQTHTGTLPQTFSFPPIPVQSTAEQRETETATGALLPQNDTLMPEHYTGDGDQGKEGLKGTEAKF